MTKNLGYNSKRERNIFFSAFWHTVLSYAVSLVTLMFFEWKYVFLTSGLILLIVSIIWLLGASKLHLCRRSIAFCFIYSAKKATINMKRTKPPHQF